MRPDASAAHRLRDEEAAKQAGESLDKISRYLRSHPAKRAVNVRVQDGGGDLVLPREALEMLARILAHLAAGEGVSVLPAHAELTTQQAADVLNVSRPYLIKLLESGEIEFRLVGRHRRVRLESLVDFMRRDDASRRDVADELTALNQEMGLT